MKTWRERLREHPRHGSLTLDELVELAKTHTMTPKELEAQRRSWVVSELVWSNPRMDWQEAERLYDEVSKNG
jgi:hypothetical protein